MFLAFTSTVFSEHLPSHGFSAFTCSAIFLGIAFARFYHSPQPFSLSIYLRMFLGIHHSSFFMSIYLIIFFLPLPSHDVDQSPQQFF
jgi:hypothetical protein